MEREDKTRIEKVYTNYQKNPYYKHLWDESRPGNKFIFDSLTKRLFMLLSKYGYADLAKLKILEIGCGEGRFLKLFLGHKACASSLYGVDVLKNYVTKAKKIHPEINVECQDVAALSFGDETFDVVCQFTTFSSIGDNKKCLIAASQMIRVLKKEGIIIWYDMRYANPWNKNVTRMSKDKILQLFPNCKIDFYLETLLPPAARLIAPFSFKVCNALKKINVFNSHYLAIIKK